MIEPPQIVQVDAHHTGPIFSQHFRIDPAVFDFEVGVPIGSPVSATGRVKTGRVPAAHAR